MPIVTDSHILRGASVIEDRGLKNGGVKVECLSCSSETVLRMENVAGYYFDRWICHICKNNLAIYEDEKLRNPIEYLHLPGHWMNETYLDDYDDIRVVVAEYDDLNPLTKAVYLANRGAKHQDGTFGGFDLDAHDAILILDNMDVVGYLSYCPTSSNSEMVLRQLYLSKSHRERRIGSAVVKFWWKNIASEWYDADEADRYYVEQPNENMIQLICAIGHDEDGDGPTARRHSVT